MKIAVLGSGQVGEVLADGFLKHGHDVVRASRDPSKLAAWAQTSGARTATFADAVADADVVVLAVKGAAASEAVALAGVDALALPPELDRRGRAAEVTATFLDWATRLGAIRWVD